MQVFVDDMPVTDVEPGNQTVGELVDSLGDRIRSDDRLVVQVECDGQPVLPDALDSTLGQPASNFRRLDFQTESTVELARAALESTATLFADTNAGRVQTIEHLATGQIPEAMHALGPCIQAWQRGFEAIVQVAVLRKVSLDQTEVDGKPIVEWIRQWSQKLSQIKEALQEQDYVLLSDVLEYELDSTAERWPQIIQAVSIAGGLGQVELPQPD